MYFPKKLKAGDKVVLLAPASPVYENPVETVRDAVAFLQSYELEVEVYDSCYTAFGYLASLNADEEINRAFADKSVSGIFALRGGYGTPRILDRLDYEIIKKNPKILIGFSDITALLLAVTDRCSFVTFHGPMPSRLDLFDPQTLRSWEEALFEEKFEPIFGEGGVGEAVSGTLLGGNLSLLAALCGTPYLPAFNGAILFIEEINEEPYKIDRMLNTLRLAGVFDRCRGLVFGHMPVRPDLPYLPPEMLAAEIGLPYIFGIKAGHGVPNLTLPEGAEVTIYPESARLEFLTEG